MKHKTSNLKFTRKEDNKALSFQNNIGGRCRTIKCCPTFWLKITLFISLCILFKERLCLTKICSGREWLIVILPSNVGSPVLANQLNKHIKFGKKKNTEKIPPMKRKSQQYTIHATVCKARPVYLVMFPNSPFAYNKFRTSDIKGRTVCIQYNSTNHNLKQPQLRNQLQTLQHG